VAARVRATLVAIAVLAALAPPAAVASPSGFVIVASPNPSVRADALRGVAAVSPTDALAVGTQLRNGRRQMLAVAWNGSAWRAVATPVRAGVVRVLRAVAAVGPNRYWAVGSQRAAKAGSSWHPLLAGWNGRGWHVETAPPLCGRTGRLTSVAVGPAGVWAAGASGCGSLVLRRVDQRWVVVPQNFARSSRPGLVRAVAVSGADIWAASDEVSAQGRSTDLYRRHAGAWELVDTCPTQFCLYNALTHVANGDVWAAGQVRLLATDPYQPIATVWTNGSFAPTSFALTSTNHLLLGVAAGTPTDVWGAGWRANTAGTPQTLLEHWDGNAWTDLGGPNASGGPNRLTGISAIPGGGYWAVGVAGHRTLILRHP
jgi:hypothetical protein